MAFALPIIHALEGPKAEGFRACIISPTRELAMQIKGEVERLAAKTKLNVRLLTKATASKNSFGSGSSKRFGRKGYSFVMWCNCCFVL